MSRPKHDEIPKSNRNPDFVQPSHVKVLPVLFDQDAPGNNLASVTPIQIPESELYEASPDADIIDLVPHIEAATSSNRLLNLAKQAVSSFKPF